MPKRGPLAALLVLLALLAACDDAGDRPTDWSYVHGALLAPACATAGCHDRTNPQAGVDLSTAGRAYHALTGRTCGAPQPGDPVGDFVRPGHPESSRLMYLLRGDRTDVMPPDAPLPDGEIAVIERWILAGAPCE